MRGQLVSVIGLCLAVAACGDTMNERMVTGALGGAAAGGIPGGPVGALVGGGVGALLGATLDESVDVKVNKLARPYMSSGQQAGSTGQAPQTERAGAAERRAWSVDQVHTKLHNDGYQRVYNIRQQGGVYLARGEREGRAYDIRVDAATGRIISSEEVGRATPSGARSGSAGPGSVDEQRVRTTLRQEGYDQVSDLRREDGTYVVRAQHTGEPYTVRIDAQTGRIIRSDPASSGGEPAMSAPPSR